MESVKKQLWAVRDAWADVEKAKEKLARAESRAEGTQARRIGGDGGGNSARYFAGDALEDVYKAQEELAECVAYWCDLEKEARKIVDVLPDGNMKLVIMQRYLQTALFSWAEIGEWLGISEKYCYTLQKQAFKLLEAGNKQGK